MRHLLCAFIAFFSIQLATIAEYPQVTGHDWNKRQTTLDKNVLFLDYMRAFVEGVYEGVRLFANSTNLVTITSKEEQTPEEHGDLVRDAVWGIFRVSNNYTIPDILPMVTEFYTDNANLDITLYGAMSFVSMRVRGESPETLEQTLLRLRREANNHHRKE